MKFHIYREIMIEATGKFRYQQIGSTRYEKDAIAILDNWHSGYIVTHTGKMLRQKNLKGPGL